jgi:hypothetical protein
MWDFKLCASTETLIHVGPGIIVKRSCKRLFKPMNGQLISIGRITRRYLKIGMSDAE